MSFLRPLSRTTSALAFRPAALRTRTMRAAAATQHQLRFATQDYGSGEGNPAGENPQAQGKRGREDLEHPGPPPPKVAQKDGKSSSSSSSSSSGKEKSGKQEKGAEKGGKGGDKGASTTKGAQPKILNESPPSKGKESEDVRRHNEDMENRAEKAHEQVSDEGVKKD